MQTFLQRLQEQLSARLTKLPHTDPILRVTVVGGGVASVEIALCLQQMWATKFPTIPLRIEIITSSGRVADGMQPRSVRRLERILRQREIKVRANQRVIEVHSKEVVTSNGQHYSTDCVLWATSAAAPPVLQNLGLQTDARGFIATKPTLQSYNDDCVFAVGDSGTILESPAPKAGVYAVRQCPILWHNLRAFLNGEPLKTFKPQKDFLKLLNTGDDKALLEYRRFTAHARWCWHLKTWIDKRFVREFQH